MSVIESAFFRQQVSLARERIHHLNKWMHLEERAKAYTLESLDLWVQKGAKKERILHSRSTIFANGAQALRG